MKKWLIYLVIIITIVAFSLPYIFIPSEIHISSIAKTERNIAGTFRSLSKTSDWPKWWPGMADNNMPFCTVFTECKFLYGGYRYQVSDTLLYNALNVDINNASNHYKTRLDLVPLNRDSTYLQWTCSFQSGSTPFSRIAAYQDAIKLKTKMDSILRFMKSFLDNEENIYGCVVRHEMSSDSTLVVIKYNTKSHPTIEEVYQRIRIIKKYIASHQAKETNFPMMLIRKNDTGGFDNGVAIPVNRALADSGEIIGQRYVPYKILLVEVKGGDSAISRAKAGLNYYISDNQYQVMARPYESLVTDRSLEKDTSKWITRLICAVP